MKTAFVDTLYWIAVVIPGDTWKEAASQAKVKLGNVRLVTTDEVLTEFLNSLAKYGEHLRKIAIQMVQAILNNPNVKVLPQTRDSFLQGMNLYGNRQDKEYSLTDCISMNAMRADNINDVLTNDHHFAQEGFNVLIAKDDNDAG